MTASDELLRCRCGRQVRIVRLGRKMLALGHTTNPGKDHHAVRLAPRSASDVDTTGTTAPALSVRRQTEAPVPASRDGSESDRRAARAQGHRGTSEPHGKRHGVPLDPPAQGVGARGFPPSPSATDALRRPVDG